jgi:hypothetical protein
MRAGPGVPGPTRAGACMPVLGFPSFANLKPSRAPERAAYGMHHAPSKSKSAAWSGCEKAAGHGAAVVGEPAERKSKERTAR